MAYLGIFLILVAAGLRLAGWHISGPSRQVRATASFRGVHAVPLGAAVFLVAASGVFIFAVGISIEG
ncbi:hypothetical protein [Paenarthrobacter aromaticivorans]|uniref:Uncharacterized protein n=1 Tax=Paenarthrobacter aromaticivorans TaxID=2849150 RepID=A0ABS6I7Q2_9MICC|nr:hypothetical protein [Paenarthrobacter sp. MMS21-TAE1-1]MBU8867751.1 hypothetical protein [Paenarthrobacter sp. MMS21-TAE1-1]